MSFWKAETSAGQLVPTVRNSAGTCRDLLWARPVQACFSPLTVSTPQAEWREEVKLHFEKIKSEGTCLHRLEEELVMRRREELRCVPVFRKVVIP